MSSPWPPRVTAVTSLTETPSSQAMNAAKRAESSTPAWPTTRWCGNPVMRWQSVTIASSGVEITMTKVVAAHAGLAGQPGRHDDDVRSLDVLVAVRALQRHVEAVDRCGLGDVERL